MISSPAFVLGGGLCTVVCVWNERHEMENRPRLHFSTFHWKFSLVHVVQTRCCTVLPWQMISLDFHKRHTNDPHLRLAPPASSKWFLFTFSLSSAGFFPLYWSVASVYPFGPHPDHKTSDICEGHRFDRDAFCICSSQCCECDLQGFIYTCNSFRALSSVPDILLCASGICKGSVDSGETDPADYDPRIHFHPRVRLSVCLSFVERWTTDLLLLAAAAGLAWNVLETVCWSTGWVVGSGERERGRETERSKQSPLTPTLRTAEQRARQASRLINIPQVQRHTAVLQPNGSGGSEPHLTAVKRRVLIPF